MTEMPRSTPIGPRVCALGLVMTQLLSGCAAGGTETDNPVVDFQSSGCKNQAAGFALSSTGVALSAAALRIDNAAYDGFHCYAWEYDRDARSLRVDVLNMNSGCAIEWAGSAERRVDGGIDLVLGNPYCAVAACGWCIYDFTFELSDVDGSQALPLALVEDDCTSREVFSELELPIDTESDGILCRPAFRSALGAGLGPSCDGALHMPCGDDACASDGPACQDDLVCANIAEDDARCLTPCESDDDCSIELLSCQDGTCKLRERF